MVYTSTIMTFTKRMMVYKPHHKAVMPTDPLASVA